jgi:hypothetical protein
MDSIELAEIIPGIIEKHLPVSCARQIMPPMQGLDAAWAFRFERAVTVLKIAEDEAKMRITVGIVIDMPYSHEVAEYINYMNYKVPIYGRLYLTGNLPYFSTEITSGPCLVAMQEIVFGSSLSLSSPPSIDNLVKMVGTMTTQGNRLSGELMERYGGRPFSDDDAMFLTHH